MNLSNLLNQTKSVDLRLSLCLGLLMLLLAVMLPASASAIEPQDDWRALSSQNGGGDDHTIYLPFLSPGSSAVESQTQTPAESDYNVSNELLNEVRQVVQSAMTGQCQHTTSNPDDIPCLQGMPFTVTNNLPTVAISSPTNGATFTDGDNITFTGTANDTEDGDLTTSLDWESDLDGSLATDSGSFNTTALSVGTHVIKASVTDSNGGYTEETISIDVDAIANPPGMPTAISPTDDITDTLPTYSWNEVTGASVTEYEILIYDRDAPGEVARVSTTPAAACGTTPCELTPSSPTLVAGTRYLWRVKARNSAGWSGWSTPLYFDVVSTAPPPGAPTLTNPNGDITDVLPTYEWQDLGTADNYEVLIYDRDLPGILDRTTYDAATVCSAGNCTITPSSPTLVVGTRYLWRVKGSNAGGFGPWSAPMYFDVIDATPPPGAPTLTNPNGDITDVLPTYEWQDLGTADNYEVLIYDRDLPGILDRTTYAAATVCSAGNCTITPSSPTLVVGTRYLWRVKGSNAGGFGPWSAPMYFDVIDATPPPSAPTLTSPNGDITDVLPTYEWQDLGTADNYEVLIYDRDLPGILDRTTYAAATVCSAGNCTITPSSPTLVAGTRYLWRVKGSNAGGFGPWSAPMYFDVVSAVSASALHSTTTAAQIQSELGEIDEMIKLADIAAIDEELMVLNEFIRLSDVAAAEEEVATLDSMLLQDRTRIFVPIIVE